MEAQSGIDIQVTSADPPVQFESEGIIAQASNEQAQGVEQVNTAVSQMDKGIPGSGFPAHLITSKYADHLPLYRQQQIYRRFGLDVSRSTMCGWVSYTASVLSPIVEAMKSSVMTSRKIHTDDTPITVLDPAAKPVGSRKGYVWVYIGDQDDVVFEYTGARKRDGPETFLKGYRGYLQADAFSGYDRIYAGGDVVEVACWAHARRKFFDAQSWHEAEAKRILELIGRLYAVEHRGKAPSVSPERLPARRQRHSRRRLDRLRRELDRLSLSVLPRSPLGLAIRYTLNNFKALNRYTEAPSLSIDNNHSERQIKQMVIGRKNWLFAGPAGNLSFVERLPPHVQFQPESIKVRMLLQGR